MTDFLEALEDNYRRGHFWNPAYPDLQNITQADLATLRPDDDAAIQSFQSRCEMQASDYFYTGLRAYGRLPVNDGRLGKALLGVLAADRCDVPDYAPPPGVTFSFEDPWLQQVCERMQRDYDKAIGNGNWAGCHNAGKFHKAIVDVDLSGLPSHLQDGTLDEALANVQKGNAQFGLCYIFRDVKTGKDLLTGKPVEGRANIQFMFVRNSDGWIGLAIVGRGEQCGDSPIWCRYLATFRGGNSREEIVNQWTTLIYHELAHNEGFSHRAGWYMNPSIKWDLPVIWSSQDPNYAVKMERYGGDPFPLDNPEPGPQPGPEPPSGLAARVAALEKTQAALLKGLEDNTARDLARDAIMNYLLERAVEV